MKVRLSSYLIAGLLSLLIASACNNSDSASSRSSESSEQSPPTTASKPSEDEILMQLSPYLIGDPSSLAEKEQNTIINYAIDRLIPIKKSDTGLFYQVLEPGEGDFLKWGDYVSAHYKGYFLDGQIFDSSYRRDQPLEFYIGNMVPGWNEGLQLLKPGGKILLLLPSALAYGEKGFPDGKEGYLVPPNQILAFEVEVLEKLKSGK